MVATANQFTRFLVVHIFLAVDVPATEMYFGLIFSINVAITHMYSCGVLFWLLLGGHLILLWCSILLWSSIPDFSSIAFISRWIPSAISSKGTWMKPRKITIVTISQSWNRCCPIFNPFIFQMGNLTHDAPKLTRINVSHFASCWVEYLPVPCFLRFVLTMSATRCITNFSGCSSWSLFLA